MLAMFEKLLRCRSGACSDHRSRPSDARLRLLFPSARVQSAAAYLRCHHEPRHTTHASDVSRAPVRLRQCGQALPARGRAANRPPLHRARRSESETLRALMIPRLPTPRHQVTRARRPLKLESRVVEIVMKLL